MKKWFVGLACALLWTGCIVTPGAVKAAEGQTIQAVGDPADELAEREVVKDAVGSAIASRDVVALSQMADRFRRERERTGSGVWKLSIFYARLLAEFDPDERQCADRSADLFRDWMAKSPKEPAAYIARAAAIEAQAWCIRGGGYAPSVSAATHASFAAKAGEAEAILSKHRATASIDPHYYAVMARLYIDRAADKAEFKAMLDQATAREPNYHTLYFEAYRYFQPQWFGSPAEIEELARYASTRATGEDRPGIYARFYWYVLNCGCGGIEQSIDWSTMKQSMRGVMAHYPASWNAANFARFACAMHDPQETRTWFASTRGDYSVAWPHMKELQQCQAMAPLDRSTARCPYAAREGWPAADVDRYCRG